MVFSLVEPEEKFNTFWGTGKSSGGLKVWPQSKLAANNLYMQSNNSQVLESVYTYDSCSSAFTRHETACSTISFQTLFGTFLPSICMIKTTWNHIKSIWTCYAVMENGQSKICTVHASLREAGSISSQQRNSFTVLIPRDASRERNSPSLDILFRRHTWSFKDGG